MNSGAVAFGKYAAVQEYNIVPYAHGVFCSENGTRQSMTGMGLHFIVQI